MTVSIRDRIGGALWGAVTGDALGVPIEFQSRQSLRENPVTAMRGFGTHGRPPGTWSDDTSLLLCAVDSFASCGTFDVHDLAERFVRWGVDGYCTPHGHIFDIGIATSDALSSLKLGVPPEEAGRDDEYSNGNGSLMRILPMGLWFLASTSEELMIAAQRASAPTHRHPRSQMACALYCLLVRALIQGFSPEKAWDQSVECFAAFYQHPPFVAQRRHFRLIESGRLAEQTELNIDSSGYVMDTLTAAVWCLLTSHSFEETVLKAVNLGGDTDTTGCVAGGLAGACYGIASIPAEWKNVLARREYIESLFARFSEVIAEFRAESNITN